jgi:hypothetical protein
MARERPAGDHRGAHGSRDVTAPRSGGRGTMRSGQNERARIAQVAARFIVEHGITDWTLAKRKAARTLMLPESAAMPSNDDVVDALTLHHALFGGEAHAAALRGQREEALAWMRRLSAWQPLLVGGVAAGWATAHSDVRIELVADDPKVIEIELASQGVGYAALPARTGEDRLIGGTQLRIDSPRAAIRLSILTPQQRRNRPRKDDELRLSTDELSTLLTAPSP